MQYHISFCLPFLYYTTILPLFSSLLPLLTYVIFPFYVALTGYNDAHK
jgi:hypothetical protein